MKRRVGELYGKPIIEGDKNLKTVNEIHIDDLSKGGDSSVDLTNLLCFKVDLTDNFEDSATNFYDAVTTYIGNESLAALTVSYLYDTWIPGTMGVLGSGSGGYTIHYFCLVKPLDGADDYYANNVSDFINAINTAGGVSVTPNEFFETLAKVYSSVQ